MNNDLFGPIALLPGIVGMRLLDRRSGGPPCCIGVLTVGSSAGPHEAALRCAQCGRHRGWLSSMAATLLRYRFEERSLLTLPELRSDGIFDKRYFRNISEW
jgi:hypothetical protein